MTSHKVDASEKHKSAGPEGASDSSEIDFEEQKVNESALLRKLDLRLLPSVTVLYLLSFLDRSNVANARIEGLTTDIGMTPNQYLTGLTLYFIGYVLFEIPCNIILKKTTPKFWLPTLTIAFGVVATLLGIVQNLGGFFTARFFLGVVESGLFPGVVFYLSMWYRRHERQFRVALFFSAASLSGAFGGILAFGIAKMDGVGGQEGWRWIFIIEGLVTIVIGALAYLFIVNYPATAAFLSDAEKRTIEVRLREDSDATNHEGFTWANVLTAIKDPKCWLYCAGFHAMSLPLYTLSLFLPTIITDLGYSRAKAQLLTIPPYALATILTVIIATISERRKTRAPFLFGTAAVAAIGYCILLSQRHNPAKRPGVSYLGTFFAAAGIYPSCGLVLSWPAVNVGGQTKRAVATAMQISIGNLGAVMGTQLYRAEYKPGNDVGHSVALGYCLLSMLVTALTAFVLTRENKKREALGVDGVAGGAGGLKGDEDPRWRFIT
ncbi:hypothetical protein FH972_023150 [Carpinus fangiana]|uniref:Major facilitator superfamily (MFS) profile domain-containing protein n=1 Tax=Carpinus fangiana TaxID=176857 RepID=A0A5N6KUL9_9ROSI|nr:hypothetical protein FH972_023150 [Carpinus fangiana]